MTDETCAHCGEVILKGDLETLSDKDKILNFHLGKDCLVKYLVDKE